MNIIVNSDRTVEKEYTEKDGSQNENRVTELNFTLPEEYSGEGFVPKIAFITEDGNFSDYIDNGKYILKNNITKYREVICFVWLTDSVNNIDFRSQTFLLEFYYNEDPSDYIPSEQEKSQIELLMEELEEKIQEVTELEENVYTKDETYSKEEVDEIIPTDISDLNNDSGFIDKDVNNLTNYYKKSETYTKQEIDSKVSSVYKYKGTVASYSNLPSTGLTIGDVYNVEDTGDNYSWTGTDWDKLGGDIDLSGYQTKIDSTHKLNSDLVDDTNQTNKFVTSTDKTNWNAKYDKPSGGIPKTDLASDVRNSLGKADTALQEHQDISGKQDITDNNLTTTNKTITSAINEVDSIAKGANQALSYGNYSTMITAFNSLANNVYNVGQNVMIITLQVPDLWISGIESTSQTYTYTTDEAFTTELNINGYVQVGYYKLSALETQKVDLTNYVTFDDYATAATTGVVKTSAQYGVSTSSYTKNLTGAVRTYDQYQSGNDVMIICKGTLENVIEGKQLINQTQLEESQEELFDVYDYSFIKNTSNNIFTTTENDTVQDKIFSITTGELAGNTYQNYLAFINYIEIKSNKNYYFALYNQNNTFNTLIGCIACFYDKNKNFISGLQISGTNQPIISPANAKYLRISISKTYYTNFKFLVSEDSYPQTYSDYFEKYYTLNKKLLINYNDIVVDVNGSGDFTTIQQAFDYIENKKDNNYHNRYNVYIKEGNYDLGANFSNEDLNNSNVSGVTVPDYTYLIGLGNKKNIVLYCTFNDKQQYISTLNLKGSCGLENITVIGTKTRYAIHVDTVQSSEYHQLIKNCIIKGIDTYYSVVYGTGTYDNAYWEFSDTIFDGTETGNNGGSGIPFTVHNSLKASGNRFIKFTNCRFKTNSTNKNAILFKTLAYRPNNPSESANNMVTYVEIYGCKFGGNGFSLVEENPTYYGTGCLYYITGYGNDNALYEIITTDGIDYSDRVDII